MPFLRLLLALCGVYLVCEVLREKRSVDGCVIEGQAYLFLFAVGALLVLTGVFLPWVLDGFRRFLLIRIVSLAVLAVFAFVLGTLLLILLYPLTVRRAKGSEPVLLVLGAPVVGEEPSLLIKSRASEVAAWLNAHRDVRAILSGGKGGRRTEAEVLRELIAAQGVDPERLLCERESATTDENFINCMKSFCLNPEQLVIVTNRFHIYRTHFYAERSGLRAQSYVIVPTPCRIRLIWYGREILLTVRYWFTRA